ncbi:coat protein [Tanacetum coccineum]|uniref:Coat protein n=1 Tax=Tanacetum coccineum TaxID=301880 RepID=A0ABQ5AHS2_9ASTR
MDAIITLFTKLVKSKEGHDLQMWRFGRIFDSQFLSVLQIKRCDIFTLVLAYILKKKDLIGNKGALEITQLKRANAINKKDASAIALRSIAIIQGNEALSHYP